MRRLYALRGNEVVPKAVTALILDDKNIGLELAILGSDEVGLAGSDKISDNLQPIESNGPTMGPGKFRSVM